MEIQVTLKNVYGKELCYPECTKAKLFARLVGAKTLTPEVVDSIKALGYSVLVVSPDHGKEL